MKKAKCINPWGLVEGEDFGFNTVTGEVYDVEFAFKDSEDEYWSVYKNGQFLERSNITRFEFVS